MHASVLATALLLGTAAPLLSQDRENCRHEAQRTATVTAAGARNLMAKVGAGSLKIEGIAGLDRVLIRGRACASATVPGASPCPTSRATSPLSAMARAPSSTRTCEAPWTSHAGACAAGSRSSVRSRDAR